jgi:hypothetical protein
MSTPVTAFQYDPTKSINYFGSDPECWPDGGPVVVPELHTARVSAYELDLERASHGKIVFTTDGDEKALEVRGLGVDDPAVIDTTVLDAGSNALQLKSDVETRFTADTVAFEARSEYRSTVEVANPSTPTFHLVATPERMIMGTGVLDPADDSVLSGAFLETTSDSFKIGHDSASISSTAGADNRIRYEAREAHEFFVGSDAASQATGSGAIEITRDKVTIRKNVDLFGTINSVATDATTLQVEDQVIRLAHTDDPATANRDALLEHSKTGITINTVPGSYADDAEYMSRFRGADGSKLFVDDTARSINVPKALESGLFTKELAFYLNRGTRAAGSASAQSRLEEPYWNLSGGALHMSHTVPNGNGRAKKFSLGFRITDTGNFEMVRLTKNLKWDNATTTFTSDGARPDSVKVIAKYVNAAA